MKKLFTLLMCSLALLACENKNDNDPNDSSGLYMLVSELAPMINCNQQDTKAYLEAKGFTGRKISSFSSVLDILEELDGSEENPLYEYTNANTSDVVLLSFYNDSALAITYYASKGYLPNQVGKWLTHPGSTIQIPNWEYPILFSGAEIYHDYFSGEEDDSEYESLSALSNNLSTLGDGDVVNVCWADESDLETRRGIVLMLLYAYYQNQDIAAIQMLSVRANNVEPVIPPSLP